MCYLLVLIVVLEISILGAVSQIASLMGPHGVANTVDRIPVNAAQSSPHNNSLNDVILANVDSGTVNKYDEVRVYVS